jgi:predicted enzyme related to lactoylglutathione lyase
MELKPPHVNSQITFFYYPDLEPAAAFYEQVMGLVKVEDQGWAKIYRVSGEQGNAFLGIVDGDRGFHQPQPKSAVLVTLVVEDVPGWYEHLKAHGVKMLTELREYDDIRVRCFFCQDPGGYSLEIQEFLRPELRPIFYP